MARPAGEPCPWSPRAPRQSGPAGIDRRPRQRPCTGRILPRVSSPQFAEARDVLERAAWRALEGAYNALIAGGLPCGAALADGEGTIIAAGRNHAYDPGSGDDPLQGTPLAHAEMNVLAGIPTDRDLSGDTLWSTQQPCAMCSAAIDFCGVGRPRYLAPDPAFLGTTDPRAGTIIDPTSVDPTLAPWAALANVMFLQPTIARGGPRGEHIQRNHRMEPEITDLAIEVSSDGSLDPTGRSGFTSIVANLWPRLSHTANQRQVRLDGVRKQAFPRW